MDRETRARSNDPTFITGPVLDYAKELLAEWQERMRLQDWDIEVAVFRSFDMGDGTRGEIRPQRSKRMAIVKLLLPGDEDPVRQPERETGKAYDLELSLVHELAHIPLLPWHDGKEWDGKDDDPRYIELEVAVDLFAKALYRAKYAEPPGDRPAFA
jgi:hypothetical protein